uniref:Stalled ribosome sensor GCN1-like HEAT repeats region domain-containing protein n=1 Tax=Romanomermis culicivorax TaxID=13658 RepID=A0A915IHZ0_ROMCU
MEGLNIKEKQQCGFQLHHKYHALSVSLFDIFKLTVGTVNTKALAHLATVAGESLNKHLGKIFSPIVTSLSMKLFTDRQPEEMENAVMVLDSVIDESGSQLILDVLLQRHYESKQIEIASAILLSYFVQNSKVPLSDSFGQIIRGCLNFYTSEDKAVINPATEALSSIVK